VRLGLPVGLLKKKSQKNKFAVHACACTDNGGEKRNFLIGGEKEMF
jgi:hypothetical protein